MPDEVTRMFGGEQILYALAMRARPKLTFTALVKAIGVDARTIGHSRMGTWDANQIGSIVLKETGSSDLRFYANDLKAIGMAKTAALFRLSFKYWHVKSVPEDEWTAMLRLMCALGRDGRGVLYRVDAESRVTRYDFDAG
ncbi:Hypothetical protein A7982_08217 [Minicystis rosea]|nr:Hypothetical protein A7982_08217 [Minicystis rosea]